VRHCVRSDLKLKKVFGGLYRRRRHRGKGGAWALAAAWAGGRCDGVQFDGRGVRLTPLISLAFLVRIVAVPITVPR